MPLHARTSDLLVCSLMFCLALLGSVAEADASDKMYWRDAPDLPGLVAHLDDWLDRYAGLPRNPEPAAIRWADEQSLNALSGRRHARGLYDPESATIWLARPWAPRNPFDVGVLLHELVHHRQAVSGHWYCPGAQELPAYRLQQAWLNDLGLEPDVNWIAVVLEAGFICAGG